MKILIIGSKGFIGKHAYDYFTKKNEDVYSLRLSNNARKTTFTKEHPIYVSNEFYSYFDGKNKSLDETKFKFDFVSASDFSNCHKN